MKLFLEKALKGKKYQIKPLIPEGSDREYFRIITKDRSYILAHSPILQQEKFLNRWKAFYEGGLNVPKVYSYQLKVDGDIPIGIKKSYQDEIPAFAEQAGNNLCSHLTELDSRFCGTGSHQSGFPFENDGKMKSYGDKNQKGFLLLEDLGDQSLEKEVLKNKTLPFSYYYQALDQIIKLSSMVDLASRKRGSLKRTKKNASLNSPVFTEEQFFKEMLWTEKYLIGNLYQIDRSGPGCSGPDFANSELHLPPRKSLQKLQNLSSPPAFARAGLRRSNQISIEWKKNLQAQCRREWQHICKTLSSFSFLLAHRDYHSRNIFIKNKKVYLIDFQDAGFFPRLYDVVSLFYDVYVHPIPNGDKIHGALLKEGDQKPRGHQMTDKEREKLLRYFVSHHPDLKSVEEIRWEMAITAVQRLFKACGSFASFSSLKKQNTHLKYIVPALKMLRKELQNLKEYPYFLSLVDMLLDRTGA
ncbi:MAG: phosphotransferase [Bdellovibrionales bacterium]|nr:phosphotransferase [Bdellovibrionales bacterium]